ncbi:hypothetical protein HPP92_004267 [Vanilla planifolia]|uniref:Uncharacterized protein n=1 Tax=Vanilla planifolia TaxID=51239 RepID=A0A835S415_VANPL|nr:hypothetical protein HPP92_004267 [Vanilla planifolia]
MRVRVFLLLIFGELTKWIRPRNGEGEAPVGITWASQTTGKGLHGFVVKPQSQLPPQQVTPGDHRYFLVLPSSRSLSLSVKPREFRLPMSVRFAKGNAENGADTSSLFLRCRFCQTSKESPILGSITLR